MNAPSHETLTTPDLLGAYYTARGIAPPMLRAIDGCHMPHPYRNLLVHARDMTSTLESHWGSPIHVEALASAADTLAMNRLVVLRTDTDGTAVEFGAIRIQLTGFDEIAREEILECRRPLGAILREHLADYVCRPSAYFWVESDALTGSVFGVDTNIRLYGRHNILHGAGGTELAEVVEILPPMLEQP